MECMRLSRIDDDAKQIMFNVYLYFLNEAEMFKRKEDGYFQKVQERVSTACCVSKGFLSYTLKENKLDEGSPRNEMWRKKRLVQAEKLQKRILHMKYKQKTAIDKKPEKIVKILPEPPPLVRKPRELDIIEQELPPLTPISKPELPSILTPFVIKSTSPPPLTPIITKSCSSNPQVPTTSSSMPVGVRTEDINPGSSYTLMSEISMSPPLELEARYNNVWIKYESDLSDYDDSTS